MKTLLQFLFVVLLMLAAFWFLRRLQLNKYTKKEREIKLRQEQEEDRQRLHEFYTTNFENIKNAAAMFSKHLDINTGYLTNYHLTIWLEQNKTLFNELKGKPFEFIQLTTKEVETIKLFNNYFINASKLRNDFNKSFIVTEIKRYGNFFDSVEGRKLDQQQRIAVVTDEDNNIVIAGAGSGKTTTIVGKVNYIIQRYKAIPREILLISFTNKSASALASRIAIEGVEAKTFHKFGKDIIAACEGIQPSIYDENQFKTFITKCFSDLLLNDKYLKKITDYFTNFLKPTKSQAEFKNQGEYIQYLKDQNFRTYKLKQVHTKERTTYKMEVVKSIEECKIANYLLFNGIDYEYESRYEYETANESYRQYKPDFTITQNGRKVYIEHFGVSRDGNVPDFFSKDGETPEQAKNRYWDKIKWARELHKENETKLVETYSYEMNEDILFENLTRHLTEAGITLQPKSPEDIWQIISNAAKDEINNFITLFETFINLMKSNNYSINDLRTKNKVLDKFSRERNLLFIDIIKPIYERYEDHLSERREIDFSDMINKASRFVASGKYNRKYSYIIIDEFQDISIGRYHLIKEIKKQNPSCKLFCVGDDWQSIYRFSGSDIALFKEFENYFGATVKSKIETTYRFNNPLIGLSSEFIQRNPNQTKKELKGISNTKSTNYKIHYSISENQDDTFVVQNIFNQLILKYKNIEEKEIYILGRYSFDIERLKNENRVFRIDKANGTIVYNFKTKEGDSKSLTAHFMTIHRSKGLEADHVIILNCNSGKLGFPSEMSDDPVLNLLLSEADQFENGEERRLFYVAMTRAKENVYFVADNSSKSKFILELEVERVLSPNRKCPYCKTADVVLKKTGIAKNGTTYRLYGCTNYSYGCDYKKTEWNTKK